jgi:hypothetical protein
MKTRQVSYHLVCCWCGRALDGKIANLTTAIEDGAAVGPVVAKLQARQAERDALLAEIGAQATEQLAIDRQTIERKVREQLASWQAQLVTNARQTLREVLDGPVRLTPTPKKEYRFEGNTSTGNFTAGLIGSFNLCGVPNRLRAIYGCRQLPSSIAPSCIAHLTTNKA